MFDMMITKCAQPKSVSWDSPTTMTLDLGDDIGPQSYVLLKGAEEFLCKHIDVKPATSRELYKKSSTTWEEFRNIQLEKAEDKTSDGSKFTLDKDTIVYLINDSKEIVDIVDLKTPEGLAEFLNQHQKYLLDITTITNTKKFFADGKNGLVKLICYDKNVDIVDEDYTPILILECNNRKSIYKVYSGILIYKNFTFVPSISCDMEEVRLSDFIKSLDMEGSLKYATDRAEEIYKAYLAFKEHPVEISLREMTNLCKKIGYKLELEDSNTLHPIENLSNEESNKKVQEFYNTFWKVTGESTYEVLQLSELKKTFRYNKMTLLDVLEILSKEYLTYDGSKITVELLGDIVFKLYDTKNVDRYQVDDVKKEIN